MEPKEIRRESIMARRIKLEEMQDHVGVHPMGDFIHIGGECIWLSEEETFRLLSFLDNYYQEILEQL